MYRFSLAMLWVGVALFAVLAAIDAMVDFMGHMQGLFLAGGAACFVGAILHTGLHRLNETAIANRRRSEQIQEDVEEKTKQVRGDVDQVRCQMNDLDEKVDKVKDLTRAGLIKKASEEDGQADEPEPDGEPGRLYQFRLRGERGREAIVGKPTPDPVDERSVWGVLLESNESRTLPGARTRPGTSAS